MKSNQSASVSLYLAALAFLAVNAGAGPIGTAFTYQGRLNDQSAPANGSYDLRFRLYDDIAAGTQVGGTFTNLAVAFSNGLFTVVLDFGAGSFDGAGRWLEVGVRKGTNDFTELSPRQPVTPVPYAMMAANLSGPLPESQLPQGLVRLYADQTLTGSNAFSGVVTANNPANVLGGNFQGNGAGLTNLDMSVVVAATNDLNTELSARIVAATNATWTASTNWVTTQGYQVTNGLTRKPISGLAPADGTNYVVDFSLEVVELTATNDIALLQSTNRTAAGWYAECVWYIQGDTTNRNLVVNSNWTAVGMLATNTPYVIASNKLTIVALSVRGGSETNVTYAIARQE